MASSERSCGRSEDVEAAKETSPAATELLLFGRYEVPPSKVLSAITFAYAVSFAVCRVADVAYLATLDCKLPQGFHDGLYPSEEERKSCLAYTGSTGLVLLARKAVFFGVVMAILYSNALVALDGYVGHLISKASDRLERSENIACFMSWCLACVSCPCRMMGLVPPWGQLLHSALFMTIWAAIFALVTAPFNMTLYSIDASFGYANVLTKPQFWYDIGELQAIVGLFTSGLPCLMLYVWVCRWKFGWLLMWGLLIGTIAVVQHFFADLAPLILGKANAFPTHEFAVGREFPPALNPNVDAMAHVVSLNRIYYPVEKAPGQFKTNDDSPPVELVAAGSSWELRDATLGKEAQPLAVSVGDRTSSAHLFSTARDVPGFLDAEWSLNGGDGRRARVGVRNGGELRKALMAFAGDRGVEISEVYLVDSSSRDARANAFAAGSGGSRVIALYDTLFLGTEEDNTASGDSGGELPGSALSVRRWSKILLGDAHGEEHPQRRLRLRRRPDTLLAGEFRAATSREEDPGGGTVSMTDAQILAVMGHELGHSALRHVEVGTVQEAAVSLFTFAALGWALQSPILAAALGFQAPAVHVGLFAYQRLLSPVIGSVFGTIQNALTRHQEYAADAYSAEVSEEYARSLQSALAKLTIACNEDPSEPWYYEMFYSDHPTFTHRWQQVAQIRQKLYRNASVATEAKPAQRKAVLIASDAAAQRPAATRIVSEAAAQKKRRASRSAPETSGPPW